MSEQHAEDAVRRLLAFIGENPAREGLVETPGRVVKALSEMCAGYAQDPAEILAKTFTAEYDELVLVRDIEFWSLCEHHLLSFHGVAHVGYIPDPTIKKVVGLSKIPRLVHCFAQRLQVQEQLTKQIADALCEHLKPLGVGVVIEATHLCMRARGVKANAVMTTSLMTGVMRSRPEARAEFLMLVKGRTPHGHSH